MTVKQFKGPGHLTCAICLKKILEYCFFIVNKGDQETLAILIQKTESETTSSLK